MDNSLEPDQLASQKQADLDLEKPADLDLHYFQNRTYLGLAW